MLCWYYCNTRINYDKIADEREREGERDRMIGVRERVRRARIRERVWAGGCEVEIWGGGGRFV